MNSKRLTVIIGEREALPVRAIPYATDWNSFTPDMLAWYLGEDDKRFSDDVMPLMPLRAYRMEDGQPAPIEPSAWEDVSDVLKNTDDKSRIGHISCLPPDAFVWLDEFQRAFAAWRKRESVAPFDELPGFRQRWREELDGEECPSECYTDNPAETQRPGDDGLNLEPTLLVEATRTILSPAEGEGESSTGGGETAIAVGIVRIKRAALIAKYEREWPAIEDDLRHSNENGLRDAAKIQNEHGYWNELAVVRWGSERGKLQGKQKVEAKKLDAMTSWALLRPS